MKIFNQNLRNQKKITTFNIQKGTKGNIKYFPAYSNEWKDTIFSFNKNLLKNIPYYNNNVNTIVKSYFSLFFKDSNFFNLKKKYSHLQDRKRMYLSNPEIKYTNDKAIITLFVVNLQQTILKKKYLNLYNKVVNFFLKYYSISYKKRLFFLYSSIDFLKKNSFDYFFECKTSDGKKITKKNFIEYRLNFLDIFSSLRKLYTRKFWLLFYKKYLDNYMVLLKKYDMLYNLNINKFNNYKLLPLLSNILFKALQKNIEYNFIHLKSFVYHPDIFTEVLSSKLKNKQEAHYINIVKLLSKAYLPKLNSIREKSKLKNYDSFNNYYKDLTIINNLNKNNLSDFIYNNDNEIHENIFYSINHKYLKGIRVEVKGRLSKRSRADRSIYSFKAKGGLKNRDSSFKGLSSVLFRGNINSNTIYSISKSKKSIGAFAVKGWIAG